MWELKSPDLQHLVCQPASQGPARRSLSSLPQRPLFIPAKTKPKVYFSHPRHPKHLDIHQRYHFRLLWACALVYPPISPHRSRSSFASLWGSVPFCGARILHAVHMHGARLYTSALHQVSGIGHYWVQMQWFLPVLQAAWSHKYATQQEPNQFISWYWPITDISVSAYILLICAKIKRFVLRERYAEKDAWG